MRSAGRIPARESLLKRGLSLPIIGRLLGQAQAATTQRYAHLAADPVRQTADRISGEITDALNGNPKGEVAKLNR